MGKSVSVCDLFTPASLSDKKYDGYGYILAAPAICELCCAHNTYSPGCNALARQVGQDAVVLLEQHLAPCLVAQQVPQVPALQCGSE